MAIEEIMKDIQNEEMPNRYKKGEVYQEYMERMVKLPSSLAKSGLTIRSIYSW